MENRNLETLAQELGLKKQQVETVLELTAEGNTIPFIARYRKEKTGNLDETQIKAIIDMDKSLTALQDRKETVLAKIEAQGKLTKAPRHPVRAPIAVHLGRHILLVHLYQYHLCAGRGIPPYR